MTFAPEPPAPESPKPERHDAEALARLHAACFVTPRPWSADEIERLLEDPTCFLVLRPGGFLLGRSMLDDAEILTIAVDPAQRRQGIGRLLIAEFERIANARGSLSAFLEVAEDNVAAIALYAAAGFIHAGRRPRYYRTPDGSMKDAEIMGKAIG